MHDICRISLAILFSGTLCSVLRADWIDDFVVAQIRQRRIPGLSLAVIRDGELIKAAGYGMANLELQVPATKETVYEIGSISKQFAAQAIMLLAEEGKLNLDDPIRKYLPSNAPDTWQAITIRNLLSQTSGLKDWTEVSEFSYRRQYTPAEFVDLVNTFPTDFRPNDDWKYSNTNFPLAGFIVAQASGLSYEAFVCERIFNPLNFPSIRFKHQEEIVANRASGYVLRDDRLENGEPFRPTAIAPSGGVLSSAVDLARWWEASLQGRLLKAASLEQALMPTQLNDGSSVAHGFAFFTDTFNCHKMVFHHGSTVGGFGSVVRYFPNEKITVAVIGNLEDGGFGAEYISKRVANVFIPGSFIGGLTESADAQGLRQAETHLELLTDVAEKKMPQMLEANYATRVTDSFREKITSHLKSLKSFVYLGKESLGSDHFMRDRNLTEARYFKMVSGSDTVYYHFRCNNSGQVAFIMAEE